MNWNLRQLPRGLKGEAAIGEGLGPSETVPVTKAHIV